MKHYLLVLCGLLAASAAYGMDCPDFTGHYFCRSQALDQQFNMYVNQSPQGSGNPNRRSTERATCYGDSVVYVRHDESPLGNYPDYDDERTFEKSNGHLLLSDKNNAGGLDSYTTDCEPR